MYSCYGLRWPSGQVDFPPDQHVLAIEAKDLYVEAVHPQHGRTKIRLMRKSDTGALPATVIAEYMVAEQFESSAVLLVGFEHPSPRPEHDEWPHVHGLGWRRTFKKLRQQYGNPPVGSGFRIIGKKVSIPSMKKPDDKLPSAITAKWNDAAANPGAVIDLGDIVVCDYCMKDYRGSSASGGLIFESKAIGPCCAAEANKNIAKYNEANFVRAVCPDGVTFQQFVLDYRRESGSGNTITIHTGDAALSTFIDRYRNRFSRRREDSTNRPDWWRHAMSTEQQHSLLRTSHTHGCPCDMCLSWWALMGPEGAEPGEYGPFTKVAVNARQREIGVEETP